MSKQGTASPSFLRGLADFSYYKRSQGAVTRKVTFGALALLIIIASMRMFQTWATFPGWWRTAFGDSGRFAVPVVVMVMGVWASFRVVNFPKFADFLIAVEGEMNKVSWPRRDELIRSSVVVIAVIVLLAAVLFGFDLFWQFVFTSMGVLQGADATAPPGP